VPISDSGAGRLSGAGDMFLAIKGSKSGKITGESQDGKHKDEIEVMAWSWGMQGRSDLATGLASGKATIRELRITKRLDRSSTALMAALRHNELLTEATLTLRKSGKTQLEYFTIKIENGRVTTIELEAGDQAGSPALFERVAFSFNKITVNYTPQGADGGPQGSTSFQDDWTTNT
jgi:type VI secretion system secreted protein Hcp